MCRVVILPVLFRPPVLGLGHDQRLLRRRSGELDEVGHADATAARRRRLVLTNTHVSSSLSAVSLPGAEKMSIRSPSATVTIARLVSGRLPKPDRVRRFLPGRFSVFTSVTRTLNTVSTAILISVLFACGATRNVYLFSSSSPVALLAHHGCEQDVAMVMDLDGAHFSSSSATPRGSSNTVSGSSRHASSGSSELVGPSDASSLSSDGLQPTGSRTAIDVCLERSRSEDDLVVDEHVVRVQLVDREHVHRHHVAQAQPGQVLVAMNYDQHLV